MNIKAKKIAQLIKGDIEGDINVFINKVSVIENSSKNSISFLVNPKYEPFIYNTKAGCVIVNKNFKPKKEIKTTIIRVKNPYNEFARVLNLFNQHPQKFGIDIKAIIKSPKLIQKNIYIGAMSYVGKNVKIGDKTQIYPQCFIGDNVTIGSNTILFPGVKIYHACKIGNNCTIHSGTVIGSDGFGFARKNEKYSKIKQIGNVIIKNNIEIGSNCTIDRATIGSTIIKNGVKLDNLIQIAHNVEIGENTVIAAQTGIAGSTIIGKNCMIGGHVAINGHIKIADDVKISGKAGVTKNITKKGAIIQGYLAYDRKQHQRSYIHFKNLSKIVQRIDKLEKK